MEKGRKLIKEDVQFLLWPPYVQEHTTPYTHTLGVHTNTYTPRHTYMCTHMCIHMYAHKIASVSEHMEKPKPLAGEIVKGLDTVK